MKKILFCLCLFLSTATYAKITAEFVPNPVKQGDAVELVLSSDTAFTGLPNIDVLQKDFVVGGQQRRQSAQWINGKGQNTYQLIYTLFPNKSGTITIQGLKIENKSLPDLSLNVRADANYETKGNISLSIDCPQANIYPSQKMLCLVFLDDSIGLVDGQIIPPQTETGTWEQLLPPLPITSPQPGIKRYQSTFVFTPKESGRLSISPFTFQGTARLKTGTRRPAGIMDFMLMSLQSTATQPVGAQSQPFTINVKEKPANFKGWWLPSTDVTLTESYQLPGTLSVGEPITRTLTLTAKDMLANDMPVPEAISTDKLKVYSNPAQRDDTTNGGQVSVVMTFVPTQSGEITLPAIQVPWFNVTKETIESASVPERKIFVTAEATTDTTPTPKVTDNTAPSKTTVTEAENSLETLPQSLPAQNQLQIPWLWVCLAVALAFLLGIGVTILILRKRNSAEHKKKKPLPDLYPF